MAREDDLQQILERLLRERRTGELEADLAEAAREVWDRRQRNTDDGGAVIEQLRALGWSLHRIERETGIPVNTARRWGMRPGEADAAPS